MPLTSALATQHSAMVGSTLVSGPVWIQLQQAEAVRENVVRLRFSEPVYWSGLLDVNDASRASFYDVEPVAGTFGLDGSAAHAVAAVAADPDPDDPSGATLLLTLDRPMTPHAAQYTVAVTGVTSADQSKTLNAGAGVFLGLFKQVTPPNASSPHPARDFANPQTLNALLASPLPGVSLGPVASASLGTFAADETGDYAFDEGVTSLKKRIYRRLVTAPGGFAHLGDSYGVGVPQQGKHLARAATLVLLAAEAEKQISLEPEVARCRVRAVSTNDGLVRFVVLVRTKAGVDTRLEAKFPTK